MLSPVAHMLKQRTAPTHERVESGLGLLAPSLSTSRLRVVIARFAGFWRGTERLLDDWAARDRHLADGLDWPRRRRGTALRHDLLGLGLGPREIAALPDAPPVFDRVGAAEALGWLYVAEGSTLGGALIDRGLRALPDTAHLRLHSFTPYPEGPGPMWRGYLDALAEWVGDDDARRDGVVGAAEATFGALERWLEPIGSEAAA